MKPTIPLIAVKAFRYSAGRINVGDLFHATPADARLLTAIGKARADQPRPEEQLPPPPRELLERIARAEGAQDGAQGDGAQLQDDAEALSAARGEYFAVLGKRPFAGWSVDVLREKIAAARG